MLKKRSENIVADIFSKPHSVGVAADQNLLYEDFFTNKPSDPTTGFSIFFVVAFLSLLLAIPNRPEADFNY